jgi:hypothetical protein
MRILHAHTRKTASTWLGWSLALLLLIGAQAGLQAQDLMFGPRIGFGFNTDMRSSELIIRNSDDLDAMKLSLQNAQPEAQLGVFGRLGLGPIFIQPEVLFTTTANDYTVQNLLDGERGIFRERVYHLAMPVMGGLKFGWFRVQAGPVYRVHLASSSELTQIDGLRRSFQQSSLGLQAGLGLDLGQKVALDVRYEAPLNRDDDEISFLGRSHELSSFGGQIVTSLGISF